MTRHVMRAIDLDGYFSSQDKLNIEKIDNLYGEAIELFKEYDAVSTPDKKSEIESLMVEKYAVMGQEMKTVLENEPNIHVYSLETPSFIHGEVSRLIAKLRSIDTSGPEFIYYIQRAYELLFNLAFGGDSKSKNNILVKTPVTFPSQNWAVHNIPDIDEATSNSVMIVMLRAALLPSMIVSKEIQEYSSNGHVTPFALFKISRDDSRSEKDMNYILDLQRSYFDLESLDGKDWFFADPMNATGGSMISVVKFLMDQGVKPRSIKFFNVISVMKGAVRIVRAIENAEVYTLWMDPALNSKAYIMPGIGDAGDRINGIDSEAYPRNMIQLIADYGARITSLYRSQVREIERTVLG
jgi:uracil phosphoribosyltransferase